VSISGWIVGASPSTPSVTGNTGNGAVTYGYSVSQSGPFSATVPTAAGTYWITATIAETTNYMGATTPAISFNITLPATPAPSPTMTPTPTMTPSPTPTATNVPTATPTATPPGQPTPTQTPIPTATATPTATPLPPTATPTATPLGQPTPTQEPSPTSTVTPTPLWDFWLTLDANNGTGDTAVIHLSNSNPWPYTVPNVGFSNGTEVFKYWNTKADSSGITFNPGDVINGASDLAGSATLYAIWDNTPVVTPAPQFSLMYWPNGGNGTSITVQFNSSSQWPYTIPDPSMMGISNGIYAFRLWNTKSDGSGKSFPVGTVVNPSDLMGIPVLYAIWQYGSVMHPKNDSNPATLTTNESQPGLNDGSIKNLDTMFAIEVSTDPSFAHGTTIIIQPGDTSILPSGTYYIRWAGNELYKPSNNSIIRTIAAATIAVPTPLGGATAESGKFKFQVTVPSDSLDFYIPISGSGASAGGGTMDVNAPATNPYDWNIDWGDGNAQVSSGVSNHTSAGIGHTYSSAGTYLITITPNGTADAWLAAFGFSSSTNAQLNGGGANIQTNRDKIVRVYGPLEPLMTRSAAQIADGTVPQFEWRYTFNYCNNLVMSDDFNFIGWDNITTVGDSFAAFMFYGIKGDNFTMNSVFNLPTDITTVGEGFAYSMFGHCSGARFNMNSVFNLPQGITMCGTQFAASMFEACSGNAFTMNAIFNFPQNIDGSGIMFGERMFNNCSGDAFTMNDVFVLPTLVAKISLFLSGSEMFVGCNGSSYKENLVFRSNIPTPPITATSVPTYRFRPLPPPPVPVDGMTIQTPPIDGVTFQDDLILDSLLVSPSLRST